MRYISSIDIEKKKKDRNIILFKYFLGFTSCIFISIIMANI